MAKSIDLFVEHEGLLYRAAVDPQRNQSHYQLVLPAAIREKILKLLHSSIIGGHFGFRRTFLKVWRKFWRDSMRGDIRQFCMSCPIFQETRAVGTRSLLKSLELPTRPNMVLGCDHYGPIRPQSFNGNKHILILVDHFSKFMKLRAVTDTSAETTAKAILEEHIYLHGMFQILVSDRGGAFISNVLKEIFRILGMKQSLTSGYAPWSDTHSERGLKTMKSMLKKC